MTRPPNMLILMFDQERLPTWEQTKLPLPGREWIDRQGVTFDRFHYSAVPCSPSRGCFFTGMYPPQHGVFGNFLQGFQYTMDPAIPTLGDLFQAQGYRTAYFGKWHLSFPTTSKLIGAALQDYGFDDAEILGAPDAELGQYNDGFTNDPIWTREAVDWLKQHGRDEQPWLLVLSLLNPHDIAYYPRTFQNDFKRRDWEPRLPPNFADDLKTKPSAQTLYQSALKNFTGVGERDEAYWLRLINTYYDLLVGTEELLEAVLRELARSAPMEDTVIVRTADHGELGSSHQMQNKGCMMYEEQLRIPFTVAYPKRFPRGVRTSALGEAVDMVPTLLEIAGVTKPTERYPWLRGQSLVGVLEHPSTPGPRAGTVSVCDDNWALNDVAGLHEPWRKHVRALATARYKFARYVELVGDKEGSREVVEEQEYELYDLVDDPFELRNLAADKAYKGLVGDLLAYLGEFERVAFAPVTFPGYGPSGLSAIDPSDPLFRPDIPVVGDRPYEPTPVSLGVPGNYRQLPFEDPKLGRLLYEEGTAGQKAARLFPSAAAQEADERTRAAFFCQLHP